LRSELDLLARLSERRSARQHRNGILMVLGHLLEAGSEEREVGDDSGLCLIRDARLRVREVARPLHCVR